MLSLISLSKQIASLVPESASIFEFERWFRSESLNVHSWGSDQLIDAVFSIEAVLSEYHFADMEEPVVKQELANHLCECEARFVYEKRKPYNQGRSE